MVVVQFEPNESRLSPSDFEALKTAIQRQNLKIKDVENFAGTGRRETIVVGSVGEEPWPCKQG